LEDTYSELALRLGVFAGVFVALAVAEALAPRRKRTANKPQRWLSHFSLVVINTIAARILLPIGAVGMAFLAERHGWGLFNNIAIPAWLAVALAFVLLDLAIYLQHVLFHAVPLLWRLHLVHHADLDFDVTTGLRFHTIEIVLSLGIKLAAVCLLGAPALAVLLFEIALNATSMFNHSNLHLPRWLDMVLRFVVVTPDMHRVHHSANALETNSNFGFNLPWWDFLLGTYRSAPRAGHEQMIIGLAEFRDEHRVESLWGVLTLPFTATAPGTAESRTADEPRKSGLARSA
jgi:sterol desaturase/sphingolipid hydroxylase (fatty acid hydroxylase superfamily)